IDISDVQGDPEGDDEVLMRMSGTCRRKVRVAYRKNIKVRECGVEDVATYARLANVTGERNDFGVHSEAYYRKAYELFAPEHAALLMASYDGKDVAGLFVFAFGRTAWYFYGASSNEDRKSTRLNSSHVKISYAVFCLKKKIKYFLHLSDNLEHSQRIDCSLCSL